MRRADTGGKRERLRLQVEAPGVARDELELRVGRPRGGAPSRLGDLLFGQVDPDPAGPRVLGKPDEQLPRPAADVDGAIIRAEPEQPDQLVNPRGVERVVERQVVVRDRAQPLTRRATHARAPASIALTAAASRETPSSIWSGVTPE